MNPLHRPAPVVGLSEMLPVTKVPLFGYHRKSWCVLMALAATIFWSLNAMVALGVVSFPLSFYLYLDPDHPWWRLFELSLPAWLNPLPHWNRFQ